MILLMPLMIPFKILMMLTLLEDLVDILKEISTIIDEAQEESKKSAVAQGVKLEDFGDDDDYVSKLDDIHLESSSDVEIQETYSPLESAVRDAVSLIEDLKSSKTQDEVDRKAVEARKALNILQANARQGPQVFEVISKHLMQILMS